MFLLEGMMGPRVRADLWLPRYLIWFDLPREGLADQSVIFKLLARDGVNAKQHCKSLNDLLSSE